jgi:hypothetical protein
MSSYLGKYGSVEVTIPAGEKIAIYTIGSANLYQKVTNVNMSPSWNLADTINNEETVSSAYSSGATLRIDAGGYDVWYEVGATPVVQERRIVTAQGAPAAMTTAAAITRTNILSGIITGTQATGATVAYTLCTGASLDEGSEFVIGEAFDWVLINLSAAAADTITVTADTGHTIVGNPIVQSAHASTGGIYGNSSQWRTRKTAADTFVTYRIA